MLGAARRLRSASSEPFRVVALIAVFGAESPFRYDKNIYRIENCTIRFAEFRRIAAAMAVAKVLLAIDLYQRFFSLTEKTYLVQKLLYDNRFNPLARDI